MSTPTYLYTCSTCSIVPATPAVHPLSAVHPLPRPFLQTILNPSSTHPPARHHCFPGTFARTRRTVPSVTSRSRRTRAASTCGAPNVTTTFAGYAWVITRTTPTRPVASSRATSLRWFNDFCHPRRPTSRHQPHHHTTATRHPLYRPLYHPVTTHPFVVFIRPGSKKRGVRPRRRWP